MRFASILITAAFGLAAHTTSFAQAVCGYKQGQYICASSATSASAIGITPPAPARSTPAQAVAVQSASSGSSCAGYWQGGRCVPNGYVAFNGGSPVNTMNQSKPVNVGGGVKQTCTLVYKYVGGRVVGNAQSVCTLTRG
jgi:hypothetical protein